MTKQLAMPLTKECFSKPDQEFSRRVGIFEVQGELIEKYGRDLSEFFGHFIIVGIRYSFSNRSFVYEGISNLFDVIEVGEIPPHYSIMVTQCRDAGGRISRTYEARRIDVSEQA